MLQIELLNFFLSSVFLLLLNFLPAHYCLIQYLSSSNLTTLHAEKKPVQEGIATQCKYKELFPKPSLLPQTVRPDNKSF